MIFLTFLKLGCYSFGGPAAHLGYFHQMFVGRKQWLWESELGELIALTQLLPGPSSSQTGFLIGVMRGGLWGGVQAWLGFTLPSAVLLITFAAGVNLLRHSLATTALQGLQLATIAVVANAVRSMHRQLSPDRQRSAIAFLTLLVLLLWPASIAQITVIVAAGITSAFFLSGSRAAPVSSVHLPISQRTATMALMLFALLFLLAEVLPRFSAIEGLIVFRAFYRSGSLVFGGGHVVLPLLQQAVVRPGWISQPDLLAGYGMAQIVPGPLFTFAAYLGYLLRVQPNHISGALLCLSALFLPGMLLVTGVAPYWRELVRRERARAALAGINASVVGLLAAALVKLIAIVPLRDPFSLGIVIIGFALLWRGKISPLIVVFGSAALTLLRRMTGY